MGNILNVSRYCTHDGPGIRTTVFLKGCPLRCRWCHNPESQKMQPEIALDAERCMLCGRCSDCTAGVHRFDSAHRLDRARCVGCGRCVSACPAGALTLYGQRVTAEALVPQLLRDRAFFASSGGGVTISGGEPLLQPDFVCTLLQACRDAGVHTAVETCGFAEEETFRRIVSLCDLLLFDVKETDPVRHLQYTGVPLVPILRNLRTADEQGVAVRLRAPIIPGLNDREEHLRALRALADSLHHGEGLEIMPYHAIGAYKYAQLGMEYACAGVPEPTDAQRKRWRKIAGA